MDNESNVQDPRGLELIALVFGTETDPQAWIELDRLLPLAGGASSAHRSVRTAISHLSGDGFVERRVIGGRAVYRRTADGLTAAHAALAKQDWTLLTEAASTASSSVWTPEPGSPQRLDEMVGQEPARLMIRNNLDWAVRTDRVPVSMLLYGPSGSGKTLTAGLISRELGVPLVHLSMADVKHGDIGFALDMVAGGGVLFMDELHAASARIRDALLVALDPSTSRSYMAVGATTDPGALPATLRRRFLLEIPLQEYSVTEGEEVVRRRAAFLDVAIDDDLPFVVARAARANPAKISRLLAEGAMLVDGAEARLSRELLTEYWRRTGRDERGFDTIDIEILHFLDEHCEGAAGMTKFVDALGLDLKLVRERLHGLRREGLVRNKGRPGHALTQAGREYLAQSPIR